MAWAKKYYERYFFPLLKPHQSVWVVPGLFGRNGTHGNATEMAATDDSLAEKLNAYWSWAQSESRITGIIPWHWDDLNPPFKPSGETYGGQDYPKTLAAVAHIVAALPVMMNGED